MTLRRINISGETPRSLPSQATPLVQWVKVADLVVDEAYQRGLSRSGWTAIRKIADAFNWSHFGAVAVAPVEGGLFALIDGQHRAHAAALCGIKEIPAIVNILPVAEQARAFAAMNSTSIKVSPLQVYRAAIASSEPWAIACRDAVEASGCRLMDFNPHAASRKIGQVFSIQLIRKLVEAGRDDIVLAGLKPLIGAAEAMGPMSGPLLFKNDVLGPWFAAIAMRPEFIEADLCEFLRRNRLMNILDAASRLRQNPEYAAVSLQVLRRDALVAKLGAFVAA
jgi:hypothetical protein